MTDLTKKVLKYISDKAYEDGKGVNYFNLLIEYTLRVVPIIETHSIKTAFVAFTKDKGYAILYNPKPMTLYNETDSYEVYIAKLAKLLAHEALHILFKHCSIPIDPKKDNMDCLNHALDSQVNSYLWNMGYMDLFRDIKRFTIVDIVRCYKDFKRKLKETGTVLQDNKDGTYIEICPAELFRLMREEIKYGFTIGFENETDMPEWKKMYEFLMKNLPEITCHTDLSSLAGGDFPGSMSPKESNGSPSESNNFIESNENSGDTNSENSLSNDILPGNVHSEFDIEASGLYVDRIFKGFAKAVNLTEEELNEALRKEFNQKNPLFKMKHIPRERLKGPWVRELSKYLNGVNAQAGYKPTWARFSRRLGEGYVGKTKDRYQDCSVFVDVSGSMTEDIPRAINQICEVATFVGRIKYFLTWDTEQCGEWININSNKLKKLKIGARGGTSLGEGFRQLARKGHTKLLIIISDMETSEEDYNILNELSLTHDIILGLVQSDISMAYDFFNHRVKVIPIGGIANDTEGSA